MECFKIENLKFSYPESDFEAICGVDLTVESGDFVTVCGKSGCGKSTLLSHLKPPLMPKGERSGKIYFEGKNIFEISNEQQSCKIGFVMQNPDNQIVTDKVWHELAFGLENLGLSSGEIRLRVAEMVSFFGIEEWLHTKVSELSGGQKQMLNLASVMVMRPNVIILDEPTSQLDPVAAGEFIETLSKINRETGTTVILSEHRLEEAFAVSDRVVVMDKGKIVADGEPEAVGAMLKKSGNDMFSAMPSAMRIQASLGIDAEKYPVTVRDGRLWFEKYASAHPVEKKAVHEEYVPAGEKLIELKNLWFRYEKDSCDVLKGISAEINRGEIFAVTGGNGAGKSTLLSLICASKMPYRGAVYVNGEKYNEILPGKMGFLPQNPKLLFLKKTVHLDLLDMLSESELGREEKEEEIRKVSAICKIDHLLDKHPYDLSGGEQQRAALAKILLMNPEILLLDEPTKGLDAHFKIKFADILRRLKKSGITIIMVSHDIEFCAFCADRCALVFDGRIVNVATPSEFFSGNSFYTTAANRISGSVIDGAILVSDVARCCGVEAEEREDSDFKEYTAPAKTAKPENKEKKKPWYVFTVGVLMTILFVVVNIVFKDRFSGNAANLFQVCTMVIAALALGCIMPGKALVNRVSNKRAEKSERHLTKRTFVSLLMILIAVPATLIAGLYMPGDRKYYFISLLIILEVTIPFLFGFEKRNPEPRDLVTIAVIAAITVGGRTAFFALPQFKPVIALVIITGVCFGGETGFLVGALSGFVSNFFFGQWVGTPWQMFAFGIIGFVAGILFKKGILRCTRASLCVFGAFATIVLYGGIMNPASVILWTTPTKELIISSFVLGFPFDAVHAVSTVFFLWFAAPPIIEKLERLKKKYGIL